MTWSRTLFVPLVLATLAPNASAGFFSRKPKPNPTERVPELLLQLKTSQDEGERTAAAEELRQYDPKSFPDVIPGLIDALGRDASAAVRSEAASSLGRLRPISQQAGYALEQAQNNDAAVRVRLSARQALLQYHIVGYRAAKQPETAAAGNTPNDANKPAGSMASRPIVQPTSRTRPVQTPAGRNESPEPPLAGTPVPPQSTPPVIMQVIPVNPGLQPVPRMPQPPKAPAPPPPDGPALPPS